MMIVTLLLSAQAIYRPAAEVTFKSILAGKGQAAVLLETKPFALDLLQGEAGAEVATHAHKDSAEILYVLEGEAVTVVGEQTFTLKPGDTLLIPADTPHSAKFTKKTRVIQLYSPPGPEQRFK